MKPYDLVVWVLHQPTSREWEITTRAKTLRVFGDAMQWHLPISLQGRKVGADFSPREKIRAFISTLSCSVFAVCALPVS